eukprot:gnl/MRDRNA2_/MRDRNA2_172831_c0_seq1.p1 gnl/MRDRNA2_/MRDRNA2_172831_c0~~gnl/MRDRNA2_/MRDRNA2_172831_c0_seq1.p1  ORF type:complete len:353 (+),score=54.12 gnl/MRDRNA2_/MRDRNA2_172831_c0_seq1:83-1141(+)
MARDENANAENSDRAQSKEVSNYDVAAGQRAAFPFKPNHARTVPKSAVLSPSKKAPLHIPTTMMLRNIPNQYNQSTLREELDNSGFADSYDFFYLPMDIKYNKNVGYAFVNFLHSAVAARFSKEWSGYKFSRVRSKKVGEVSTAYIQGLEKNLQHFRDKAVSMGNHRPIVVMAGREVDVDQALASLSEESKSKISLANFKDPCHSTSRSPEKQFEPENKLLNQGVWNQDVSFDSLQLALQQAVSMIHHETKVPTAFPDTVQQLSLAGFVCPYEPRYIQPGAFSSNPATMVRPAPRLLSPESWRPSASPPQDGTRSLQDALESMQKLSFNTGNQRNASTLLDAYTPTPSIMTC